MPTDLFVEFLEASVKKPIHALTGASFLAYAFSGYCGAACQSDAGDLKKLIKDFVRMRDIRGELSLQHDIDSDDPNFRRSVLDIDGKDVEIFQMGDLYFMIK